MCFWDWHVTPYEASNRHASSLLKIIIYCNSTLSISSLSLSCFKNDPFMSSVFQLLLICSLTFCNRNFLSCLLFKTSSFLFSSFFSFSVWSCKVFLLGRSYSTRSVCVCVCVCVRLHHPFHNMGYKVKFFTWIQLAWIQSISSPRLVVLPRSKSPV